MPCQIQNHVPISIYVWCNQKQANEKWSQNCLGIWNTNVMINLSIINSNRNLLYWIWSECRVQILNFGGFSSFHFDSSSRIDTLIHDRVEEIRWLPVKWKKNKAKTILIERFLVHGCVLKNYPFFIDFIQLARSIGEECKGAEENKQNCKSDANHFRIR